MVDYLDLKFTNNLNSHEINLIAFIYFTSLSFFSHFMVFIVNHFSALTQKRIPLKIHAHIYVRLFLKFFRVSPCESWVIIRIYESNHLNIICLLKLSTLFC